MASFTSVKPVLDWLDRELPAASPELVRLVVRQEEAPRLPPGSPTSHRAPPGRAHSYALAALEHETGEMARCPKGQRNDRLNRAAYNIGRLVGAGGLAEGQVTTALERAAAACGLVEDDRLASVQATIASGLAAGRGRPRNLPGLAAPVASDGGASSQGARQREHLRVAQGAPSSRSKGGDPSKDLDPDVLRVCAGFDENDTGNGERLFAHSGRDIINVRDVGPHIWIRTHWSAAGADEALDRLAQETAKRIAREAFYLEHTKAEAEAIEAADGVETSILASDGRSLDAHGKLKKHLAKKAAEAEEALAKRQHGRRQFAIASGNSPKITGMIARALPHKTHAPEELDADPMAVNLRNGTLRFCRILDPDCPDPDVERLCWGVRLDAHARTDLISKVMPVDYDPDAECPAWTQFMERFQPDERVRRFLRAFHGYAITGLMGEQIFLFDYGLGANGKSTFMEAIARLMGSYACMLPAEALAGDTQRRGDQATPEFARLPGARLVRCAELPRGQGFRENTIKLLTGGEPLLVRHLHRRFFEFQPTFKAIGSGNDRPSIGGVDEGIWRRVRLVPWNVTIPPDERRPWRRFLPSSPRKAPAS